MFNLRPICVRNVILRSVLSSASFHKHQSASCSIVKAEDLFEGERVLFRRPKFEAVPETGQLAFTIPGLSFREETFLKQQVRIILEPDCMAAKIHSQEFPVEEASSKAATGFLDRRNFERVFPSTKGMKNMVACVHQLNKVYPGFKIPRRETDRYSRNLISPIASQRLAEGLHLCGVRQKHLKETPALMLMSHSSYVGVSDLADLAEVDLSNFLKFFNDKKGLRGNFIRAFIKHVVKTLEAFEFTDEALAVSRISLSSFDSITLSDMYRICTRHILESIARRQGFNVDVKQYLISFQINKVKSVPSPKNVARNYFIFHQILNKKIDLNNYRDEDKFFRDYTVPEPLETLITLNVYYQILSTLQPSLVDKNKFIEAFVMGASHTVRTPPTNLPLSVRRQILSDIGFTDSDIAEIILSPKCAFTDKSTNLRYSDIDYVPKMKERLTLLQAEAKILGLDNPVEFWSALTNWASVMHDVAASSLDVEPSANM